MDNVKGIQKTHMDGWKESESQDQTWKKDKDIWIMWKGYGKHLWIDKRKVKVKIKDGKRIMNGKMETWKVCM